MYFEYYMEHPEYSASKIDEKYRHIFVQLVLFDDDFWGTASLTPVDGGDTASVGWRKVRAVAFDENREIKITKLQQRRIITMNKKKWILSQVVAQELNLCMHEKVEIIITSRWERFLLDVSFFTQFVKRCYVDLTQTLIVGLVHN